MHQEKELRIADPDTIAVLQLSSFDGDIIDESPVETVEVQNYKLVLLFIDS